jgi:hypothetical protein
VGALGWETGEQSHKVGMRVWRVLAGLCEGARRVQHAAIVSPDQVGVRSRRQQALGHMHVAFLHCSAKHSAIRAHTPHTPPYTHMHKCKYGNHLLEPKHSAPAVWSAVTRPRVS